MSELRISLIQADLRWEDPDGNRTHFDQLLKEVPTGADLVLLPETFNTGFPVDPLKFAETQDGPTMNWLSNKAQELNAVICGTMLLNIDGHYHNSLVWMRPDGSYALYNKRHTFAIGGEKEPIEPGKAPLVVELKGWKIKPMICYDIRFPLWARNHYQNGVYDYDLGLYLANFPESRIEVWNTLLKARAIENQTYYIGVNRIGDDPEGVHYNGKSQMINARGEILCLAEPDQETVLSFALDYEALQHFREKFPVGKDWDSFCTHTNHFNHEKNPLS
ncbi:MAG: nitrilase family protein [Bacteroidales bacterium]|nr:nitrilase family protein [Bacteroidales bacterium]